MSIFPFMDNMNAYMSKVERPRGFTWLDITAESLPSVLSGALREGKGKIGQNELILKRKERFAKDIYLSDV